MHCGDDPLTSYHGDDTLLELIFRVAREALRFMLRVTDPFCLNHVWLAKWSHQVRARA